MQSLRTALSRAAPVAIAACAALASCRGFELDPPVKPPEDQPPRVSAIATASTDPDAGLAGFWGDQVVVTGERLDRVTVRIGGTPVRVVEGSDGGTRLVVEVPDLGQPATTQVEIVGTGGGAAAFNERAPLRFLGPGQVRAVRAGTQESLNVPTLGFGDLRTFVPPACQGADGGVAPECADLPLVQEASRQIALATGSADYVLPLALDFNVAAAALEAPSVVLSASGLALPFRFPVVGADLFPSVIVALDGEGFLHAAVGVLFQLAPDSGWMLAGESLKQLSTTPIRAGAPLSAQLQFDRFPQAGVDGVGRLLSLVEVPSAHGPPAWGLGATTLRWTDEGPGFGPPQVVGLASRGKPLLVASEAGVLLAGAVALGADGDPVPGASVLSQVVHTATGWSLAPVQLQRDAQVGTLEDLLSLGPAARAELSLLTAASSPDGNWLAVSFFDPGTTAPRLALAQRLPGQPFQLRGSALSLNVVLGLALAPQGDPPAIFGLEAISGQVVRIDPVRLLPVAGYSVPGLASPTDLRGVAASADGRYLLIGDARGNVHRFSTESATFLPPLVSERRYGAFQVLSDRAPAIRLALSEGLGRQGGAPGQVTLSASGQGAVALGGGTGATGAVFLEPGDDELLRFALTGPGLERGYCDEEQPCGTDGAVQLVCAQGQCRAPGELRTTGVSDQFTFHSSRCALGAAVRALAVKEDGEVVIATGAPEAGGAAGPVELHRLAGFPGTCADIQGWLAQAAAVTLTPPTDAQCGAGACAGPLPLVVLPDGREAIALDGPWGVALVDGAQTQLLPRPWADAPWGSALVPVALAADQRPCGPGFIPALVVAWRLPDGGAGTVTVHALADAECQPVTPTAAAALAVQDVYELDGLNGLGLSPNGRQVLAVVDQGVTRRVVALEIVRASDGAPRSVQVARVADLGPASFFFDPEPQPGRVAFSRDGSTAWTVLPGPAAMISIE